MTDPQRTSIIVTDPITGRPIEFTGPTIEDIDRQIDDHFGVTDAESEKD